MGGWSFEVKIPETLSGPARIYVRDTAGVWHLSRKTEHATAQTVCSGDAEIRVTTFANRHATLAPFCPLCTIEEG
jgi:hypothetical protein